MVNNNKPAAEKTILRRVEVILEAEGLGSVSLTQKVSAAAEIVFF